MKAHLSPQKTISHNLKSAQGATGRTTKGKTILLVDDDTTVRGSLKGLLEAEGYSVLDAENGQVALEIAHMHRFDLVLLDLNMPVKNGWDTFEQLSVDHPLVPVVIITARPNQLFTALSAGAGALLEKPMEIPTLLETIARLLAQPTGEHLARLAGQKTDFYYYKPIPSDGE